MAVDPLGWAVGFGLNLISGAALEEWNKRLRPQLQRVAEAWAKTLGPDLALDPSALFAANVPSSSQTEADRAAEPIRAARDELRIALLDLELPAAETWLAALVERWDEINAYRDTADLAPFFRADRETVVAALRDLGAKLHIQCARNSDFFRPAAIEALHEIRRALEQAEAGRRLLPGDRRTDSKLLLERYLEWLVEEYSELELPNIGTAGRRHRVPLETIYVALRGDQSSADERAVSQSALEEEARRAEGLPEAQELDAAQRQRFIHRQVALVARNPLPLSIEERDRPSLYRPPADRTISLGEAFQRERRLVILGDPGSGKTTLVRWLTLQLARAWQSGGEEARVRVAGHQVDPDSPPGGPGVDLGPARVPILVRVATFAAALKKDSGLSLSSFVGHHLGSAYGRKIALARGEEIDPAELNALLLEKLRIGQAAVFLDGLDEIGDHDDRREVVRKIDRFINGWLAGSYGVPAETGGNQVLITSRLIGYRVAPLRCEAAHLTVEPMGPKAISRFCQVWVRAMPPAQPETLPEEERARQELEGLEHALGELQARGAGDLASNPLLLTILALVYRSGQSSFPPQRVQLYEAAVRVLLEVWRRRSRARGEEPLEDDVVLAALVPLAAEIHERSPAGVVEEARLKKVLARHLGAHNVRPFLSLVQEDVGLLSARGRNVYGFLHLTFQEYLASAALVEPPNAAAMQLVGRLGSPRWREPILMAIGRLSCTLEEADFRHFLLSLLDRQDAVDTLIPRLPLLIAAALPEMVSVPAGVVEATAERLLAVYADHRRLERFPTLREQIETAFTQLCFSDHAHAVERVLGAALRNPAAGERAPAAARLVMKGRLYSAEIGIALASALPQDAEAWDWPVDDALRDLAAREPRFLPGDRKSLRRFLNHHRDLAKTFTTDAAWRRLCLAVYGGLDRLLEERTASARAEVDRLRAESQAWSGRTQEPDHQEVMARFQRRIDEAEAALKGLAKEGNLLSVERMHRDSPITPLVCRALPGGSPTAELVEELWRLWRNAGDMDARRDALLALAALGESVSEELRQGGPAAQAVVSQLPRLIDSLRPAVSSAAPAAAQVLAGLAAGSPPEKWRDLLTAVVRVSLEVTERAVTVAGLATSAPSSELPFVLAEVWGRTFADTSEDATYNAAVTLDTIGGDLADPPMLLAETLAMGHQSVSVRWDHRCRWDVELMAPRPRGSAEVLAAALDALVAIPERFDFVRGWALAQLSPVLHEHGLLLEGFIIAVERLSDRYDARRTTLARLTRDAPELARCLVRLDRGTALWELSEQLPDPYLRFRAYHQLSRRLTDLRRRLVEHAAAIGSAGTEMRLLRALPSGAPAKDAIDAALAIDDPAQKVWALERLVATSGGDQRDVWLAAARDAALAVAAPAPRARFLTRLALYYPLAEGRELHRCALEAAGMVVDDQERSALLADLGPICTGDAGLAIEHRRQILELKDSWLRARAAGQIAPHVIPFAPTLAEKGIDTAPIVLGAVLADLRRERSLPDDLAELWTAVSGPRGAEAVAELRRRSRSAGLRLTREAAVALDHLLETVGREEFLDLLRRVDHPEAAVTALLEDWRALPEALAPVDLLLAEAGELSERTIPTLVELLEEPDDRVRCRAFLALHGFGSEDRLTTSGIGVAAVELLARAMLATLSEVRVQARLALFWAFNRLHHSDSAALAHWSEVLDREDPGADEAEEILRSTGFVDAPVWPTFRDRLRHGGPRVQRALFTCLCHLLVRSSATIADWNETASVLSPLAKSALGEETFLLDGPGKVVEAAAAARGVGATDADLAAAAERELMAARRPLSSVLEKDASELRLALTAIGDVYFVSERHDKRVAAAAQKIEAEPRILDALVGWLAVWLDGDLGNPKSFNGHPGSDLLCVIAAAAERWPYRFLDAAAARPWLARGLSEAAAYYDDFAGRRAAHVLLSHLRRISRDTVTALRAGLRDVADVQETVLQVLDRYREIDDGLLPELVRNLHDPSPAVAFATGQLLASLARNSYLESSRPAIAAALAELLDSAHSSRDVYVLTDRSFRRMEHRGRLDELLYRLLSEIQGTIGVGSKRRLRVAGEGTG